MSEARDSNLRLTDEEFIQAFEACVLSEFHHRDHIRAAWVYLRRYKDGEAASRMAEGIRRFARHHGAETKYHETVTRAWMRLVRRAFLDSPQEASFPAFIAAHPDLLDAHALEAFYSAELLASERARETWMPRDRRPLP